MKQKKKISIMTVLLSLTLFLSSCSLPGLPSGNDENTISVGALVSSESQILANIVKGMVEHYTDKKINLVSNLGTSTVVHQAMLNGDIGISASRFTGTDMSATLQIEPEMDPVKGLALVQKEFQKRYDQKWYPSYGFANTYAFMVTKETAAKYNLEKISDLKDVAGELSAGVDTAWLDKKGDGYQGFVKAYGFEFGKAAPMQIGLVYDAVAAGKMDLVLGYSTDGRIASYDLVILEDDLHFFPPYDCSIVVGNELLKKIPELDGILMKLAGKIDTSKMQEMNYQVDNDLLEPEIVADRFLQENNYFKDEGAEK